MLKQRKRCSRCGKVKSLAAFFRNRRQRDGHQSECKECTLSDHRAYQQTSRAKKLRRGYDKKYNTSPRGLATRYAATQRHKKKHPERPRVHLRVLRALRSGKLIKQPCAVCGRKRVQAHHEDYSKPLDVIWLCAKHHREHHKKGNHHETGR